MLIEPWQLKQRQSLPLAAKVRLSEVRIRAWYEHWKGQVYVSFSGGKDSTVLLHLVRSMYPGTPAVFVDTGLEYPEIRNFVKQTENVTWLKPKKTFRQVLEQYGYPVISKQVSMGISRHHNTKSEAQKTLRLMGGLNPSSGKKQAPSVSKKYHYLVDAPFRCSEQCCRVLKKDPFNSYSRETARVGISGTMAYESSVRKMNYLKNGCNAFDTKTPRSTPLSFWLEEDIWAYLKENNVPYSKIYDMGETRTGCMFCMFGVHLEEGDNRFQRMAKSHPAQYKYCIETLGCGKVLDFIGVPY